MKFVLRLCGIQVAEVLWFLLLKLFCFSRYDSVVAALHEKSKDACPECGLRMDKGESLSKHRDWHIQQKLQRPLIGQERNRSWYGSYKVCDYVSFASKFEI